MSDDDKKSLWQEFKRAVNFDQGKEQPDKKDENIRDQDNSSKRFNPPNNESQPRSNAAPYGMSGIKKTESDLTVEFTPDFEPEKPNIDLSLDNTLIDGKTDYGVEFIIKQEDAPSSIGIDDGRISRLTLIQDGAVTAHYDDEWIIEPKTPLEIQTVDDIQDKFGEVPQMEFKGFHDPDPDNNHEI